MKSLGICFLTLTRIAVAALPLTASAGPSFPSERSLISTHMSSTAKDRKECAHNLSRIYMLIKLYLHHSGGALEFPKTLDDIAPMASSTSIFFCPMDKAHSVLNALNSDMSYEIVSDPLAPTLSGTPPDQIAIIAEKKPIHNGTRLVLFFNGSVKDLNNAQFERLRIHGFVNQ